MSTPDFDNVIGGPAKCQLTATDIGHTQGGISATITPETRAVTVDQFGSAPCNIRHTGQTVEVTVRFAEYAADTLAEVLEHGNDQTAAVGAKYMGIGRTAGFIHTDQALEVIPLLTADAAKTLELHRATATGPVELTYDNQNDLIFETVFTGLIDESQDTDGEYMGKINLTSS